MPSTRAFNRQKRKRAKIENSNYIFDLPEAEENESDALKLNLSSDLSKPAFLCRKSSISHRMQPKPSLLASASLSEDYSNLESQQIGNSKVLNPAEKSEYVGAVLSTILSTPGVCLSAAEKIVSLFNLYTERFSTVENNLPSVRYFWDKRSKSQSVCVYELCEKQHSHGPFYGEPKNFGFYTCDGESHPVQLKPNRYFLRVPLKEQLEIHLPLLPESCWQDSSDLEISNSSEAKRVKNSNLDSGTRRLTLTLHADEVSVGNSSNSSIFPIFVTVNEMSRKFRRENFFLVALFVGRKKPPVEIYLGPVIEEFQALSKVPIIWKNGSNSRFIGIQATFHLIGAIADAPMRAYLRNVRQFNHLNGCDWCLVQASSFQGARVYPNLERNQIQELKRNKADFLNFKKYLANNSVNVDVSRFSGLMGISPLLELDDFDIVKGFAVEPMHCIVLGIFRAIISKSWLTSDVGSLLESKIDKNLFKNELGSRLKSIMVPSEFSRPTRDLNQIKFWKSAEFDSFLCYYFLPSIRGLLKPKAINNILCLSRIYLLLNKESITNDIVCELKNLVEEFQRGIDELYGKTQKTYNLHILTHIPDSVASLGPFANLSAYPVENQMGILKEKVRRTSNIAQNLVRVFLNDFKHRELMETKVNFWTLNSREKKIFGIKKNGIELTVTTIRDENVDTKTREYVTNLLLDKFGLYIVARINSIQFFKSISVSSVRFSTEKYSADKSRNDSIVRIGGDGNFFQIQQIFEIENNYFFLGKEFKSAPVKINFKGYTGEFSFQLDHIHELKGTVQDSKIQDFDKNMKKAILIRSSNFHFKYSKDYLIDPFLDNK